MCFASFHWYYGWVCLCASSSVTQFYTSWRLMVRWEEEIVCFFPVRSIKLDRIRRRQFITHTDAETGQWRHIEGGYKKGIFPVRARGSFKKYPEDFGSACESTRAGFQSCPCKDLNIPRHAKTQFQYIGLFNEDNSCGRRPFVVGGKWQNALDTVCTCSPRRQLRCTPNSIT